MSRLRALRTVSLLLGVLLMISLGPAVARAAGPEQITNGNFDNGLVGWTAYPTSAVIDGRGCLSVPAGTGAYGAAISQQVPLVAGETYELSFDITSDPATNGYVRVVVQSGPDLNYTQFLTAQKFAIPTATTSKTFTFTASADYPSADVLFQQDVSNDVAYRLCLDNVSLTGGAEPEVYQPNTGPRVRVNQVGYLPNRPKAATLVTKKTAPVRWSLLNTAGRIVEQGRTRPAGVDPSSGLNVAVIDFGAVRRPGTGYTLVADGEASYPFTIGADIYAGLRPDAKTLFYTQRSGTAILDALAPGYGRAAGHVGVAPNQGDTAAVCLPLADDAQKLYDEPWTCSGPRDVSGGWYDAGDHGKYVVNGGISVAQLMQEFERTLTAPTGSRRALADGTLAIPESDNGVPDILDEVRWELEWMLKMQVPTGEPYAGLAYHKVADANWTGLPTDPASDPQARYVFRPSTAAGLNLAAATAQGARLFERYDRRFAARLLRASMTAYAAAEKTPDLYAPAPDATLDPNPGSGPYDDDDVSDEFYWAASELYLTTSSRTYRKDVLASPHHTGLVFDAGGFSWNTVAALGRLDLATVPNRLPDRDRVIRSVVKAADGYLAEEKRHPFGSPYVPADGNYAWGSNSAVLNILQVVGTAYDLTERSRYADAVLRGVDYVFGRNALNISYVTGYGTYASQNQHSRMYAHQVDPRLPNPPRGTLAGGPNGTALTSGDPIAAAKLAGCVQQLCYIDDIGSWSTNELTINWNAPLS
ncbi:MAG TPA: glycoside hydrolase family 9 protein, partial [Microlunatus sp.]|nr:glycoside hydrolase family 9 protein [Microlunatus sp.]